MTSRPTYGADVRVIAACANRGDATITARKLERWRQAGCLPIRPVERGPGLRGTSTVNSEGYVDQVLAISDSLRSRVALRYVPIALFADGYPVDLEVVRAAYLNLIEALAKVLPIGGAKSHDELLDQVDNLARTMAGHLGGSMLAPMAKRARQVAKQAGSGAKGESRRLLEAALSAAFAGLWAGQEPSIEGTGEVLTLIGLKDGQDLSTSARHLGETSIMAIEAAVRAADQEQWHCAREMVDLTCRYMRARRGVEELTLAQDLRLPGLELEIPQGSFPRGCLIPQLLLIGDDERAFVRNLTAGTEAFERLAVDSPERFRPYLQPQVGPSLAEQSEEFRVQFARQVHEWVTANPRDAQLLGFETESTPPGAAVGRRGEDGEPVVTDAPN
jgi:hypothetical protein